jgi:hypothetical protein
MTSIGTSDMFTGFTWGVSALCSCYAFEASVWIRGVWRVRREKRAVHTSVAKRRVLPHHLFTSSHATQISNQHKTFTTHALYTLPQTNTWLLIRSYRTRACLRLPVMYVGIAWNWKKRELTRDRWFMGKIFVVLTRVAAADGL